MKAALAKGLAWVIRWALEHPEVVKDLAGKVKR